MLDAASARVELYADSQPPIPMSPDAQDFYVARVPAARDAGDFTARVIPYHPKAFVPLETNRILWQK
jgi:hypothetical protein